MSKDKNYLTLTELSDEQRGSIGNISVLWRGANSFQDRYEERRQAFQIQANGNRAYMAVFVDVVTLFDSIGRFKIRSGTTPNLQNHLVTMTVREGETAAQIVENFKQRPLPALPTNDTRDHHQHLLELYTVIPLHEDFPAMRTSVLDGTLNKEEAEIPDGMISRIKRAVDAHNAALPPFEFEEVDFHNMALNF